MTERSWNWIHTFQLQDTLSTWAQIGFITILYMMKYKKYSITTILEGTMNNDFQNILQIKSENCSLYSEEILRLQLQMYWDMAQFLRWSQVWTFFYLDWVILTVEYTFLLIQWVLTAIGCSECFLGYQTIESPIHINSAFFIYISKRF